MVLVPHGAGGSRSRPTRSHVSIFVSVVVLLRKYEHVFENKKTLQYLSPSITLITRI